MSSFIVSHRVWGLGFRGLGFRVSGGFKRRSPNLGPYAAKGTLQEPPLQKKQGFNSTVGSLPGVWDRSLNNYIAISCPYSPCIMHNFITIHRITLFQRIRVPLFYPNSQLRQNPQFRTLITEAWKGALKGKHFVRQTLGLLCFPYEPNRKSGPHILEPSTLEPINPKP